jgi:hypothetical protein
LPQRRRRRREVCWGWHQGAVVGEEVDVEEVAAFPEIIEDGRSEESAAKATAFGATLKRMNKLGRFFD